ncbi:MAG TPA: choice-of-anchor D domain-containing protein [Solirubrobacterales bacterium]|nr:choice-of-anchor D domain-containing protein [Solirubrobacterales bacterium]
MTTPAQPRQIGTTVLVLLALALTALALPASALAAPEEGNGTLTVSPQPLVLAPTTVNYQSQGQPVQIGYEGEGEVSINKVTIEGEESGEFFINNVNCTTNLSAGQQCEVSLGMKPGSLGEKHAQLTVIFSGLRPQEQFEISGRGVAPELSFEPSSYDFGLVRANREQGYTFFQLTNSGEGAVQLNYIDFEGPGENSFWTDNGQSNCWGNTLSPGQSCSLQVTFSPQQRIAYEADLNVFVNGAPGVAGSASVSGEGGGAQVEASVNPLNFGTATAGSQGTYRTVTLTNNGNMSEGFFIGVIAGGDAGSFELVGEHCTMTELQPGQSCSAQVRFHPNAPGSFAAHLAFFGDGEGGVIVQLEGEGISGAGSIAPGSFDFGSQAAGTRSAPHVFTVTNTGTAQLGFDRVSLGGTELDQFVVSGDDCSGAVLAAGESCEVRVRFAPDSVGIKHAALKVSGDAPTVIAALEGTGGEPIQAALPSPGGPMQPPVGASGPGASPAMPPAPAPHRHRHRRFVRGHDVNGATARHARQADKQRR